MRLLAVLRVDVTCEASEPSSFRTKPLQKCDISETLSSNVTICLANKQRTPEQRITRLNDTMLSFHRFANRAWLARSFGGRGVGRTVTLLCLLLLAKARSTLDLRCWRHPLQCLQQRGVATTHTLQRDTCTCCEHVAVHVAVRC